MPVPANYLLYILFTPLIQKIKKLNTFIFFVTKNINICRINLLKNQTDGLKKGKMDPRVSEDKVPAYDIVETKIRHIDNTVIIFRIFYMLDTFIYKFQLLRKDKLCILEIPKKMLLDLKNGDLTADKELTRILESSLEGSDCWNSVAT